MNIVKLKLAIATLLISSVIFSCKKDKNNGDECPINMNSLSGTYKLISLKYKLNSSAPEQDYLAFMDDCEKDDVIILNQSGTYRYQDAGTVCSPNGSSDGEWSVHGHTLTSDGLINGRISSFDCKKIVYNIDNINTDGDRLVFVMEKQW
jgi:Lipocalin-like domain